MNINNRWIKAQIYEKEWWDKRQNHITFDFYKAYADELIQQIQGIMVITPATSILEIGSGAGGIITFLNSEDRHAIDPLETFYSSIPSFTSKRDHNVKYQTAKAEQLPYKSGRFDLIICDNVLDHCDDISKVFSEMRRVMCANGKIYLRLNNYTFWGRLIRLLVEILKIDPGHPHTFTSKSIRKFFKTHKLRLISVEENKFLTTWLKEVKSGSVTELLKALTLSTPNKTMFLLDKI